MTKFEELEQKIAAVKVEAVKFYEKSNAVAGTRFRKGLQDIKQIAQAIRNEVTVIKAESKAAKKAEK